MDCMYEEEEEEEVYEPRRVFGQSLQYEQTWNRLQRQHNVNQQLTTSQRIWQTKAKLSTDSASIKKICNSCDISNDPEAKEDFKKAQTSKDGTEKQKQMLELELVELEAKERKLKEEEQYRVKLMEEKKREEERKRKPFPRIFSTRQMLSIPKCFKAKQIGFQSEAKACKGEATCQESRTPVSNGTKVDFTGTQALTKVTSFAATDEIMDGDESDSD